MVYATGLHVNTIDACDHHADRRAIRAEMKRTHTRTHAHARAPGHARTQIARARSNRAKTPRIPINAHARAV